MNKKVVFSAFVMMTLVLLSSSLIWMAPAESPRQPKQSSNFAVEIDGISAGSFMSVEGIGMETDVIRYREGNDDELMRLTNGISQGGPIVLRSVFDPDDSSMWDWYQYTIDQEAERRAMSIIFFDKGNTEAHRFNFFECWPSAYYLEPLDAQKSDVNVEVVVIQFEWMEWA
jgi:phage tail-like protein